MDGIGHHREYFFEDCVESFSVSRSDHSGLAHNSESVHQVANANSRENVYKIRLAGFENHLAGGAKNSVLGTNTPRLAISTEAARIEKYDSTAIYAANGACAHGRTGLCVAIDLARFAGQRLGNGRFGNFGGASFCLYNVCRGLWHYLPGLSGLESLAYEFCSNRDADSLSRGLNRSQ